MPKKQNYYKLWQMFWWRGIDVSRRYVIENFESRILALSLQSLSLCLSHTVASSFSEIFSFFPFPFFFSSMDQTLLFSKYFPFSLLLCRPNIFSLLLCRPNISLLCSSSPLRTNYIFYTSKV